MSFCELDAAYNHFVLLSCLFCFSLVYSPFEYFLLQTMCVQCAYACFFHQGQDAFKKGFARRSVSHSEG
jgi:hypothetical protein